eukprot:gene3756-4697_t
MAVEPRNSSAQLLLTDPPPSHHYRGRRSLLRKVERKALQRPTALFIDLQAAEYTAGASTWNDLSLGLASQGPSDGIMGIDESPTGGSYLGVPYLSFSGAQFVPLKLPALTSSAPLLQLTVGVYFRTSYSASYYSECNSQDKENWSLLDFDRGQWFSLSIGGAGQLMFSTKSGSVHDMCTLSPQNTYHDNTWRYVTAVFDSAASPNKMLYMDGIYVDGPRADANGVAACASWIGTLAEAQAKCDADASCKVLHDDGCDDENWRYCSSVPYTTSGGGCTKVPSTGLLLKSEFSDVVDQATGDSATLADSAALAGSTLCTNGAGYAQWYANAARTFSGDWALEMTVRFNSVSGNYFGLFVTGGDFLTFELTESKPRYRVQGAWNDYRSLSALSTGVWYTLRISYSSSSLSSTLSVDGLVVGITTYASDLGVDLGGQTITIGKRIAEWMLRQCLV